MEEAVVDVIYKYNDFSLQGYLGILCIVAMMTYFILYRGNNATRARNTARLHATLIMDSTMYCPPQINGEEIEEQKDIDDERVDPVYEDIWSPFERLPRELVFEILDYVPESVRNLKLTSRLLGYRVDDYAKQDRIPFVKEIDITETGWNSANEISVHVPRKISDLFELRIKTRKADKTVHALQAKRSFHSERVYSQTDPVLYKLKYKTVGVDRIFPLEKWLGKKLGKVTLFNCAGSVLDSIIDQLKDFVFRNLEISLPSLPKKDFEALLNVVKTHSIEHLSLSFGRVGDFDHEGALLDLSSHVRILYLGKRSDGTCDDLFNIHQDEWARIVLEMFSRRLDTLCLHDRLHTRFISFECLKTTLKELPRIGKKVWFQSTGINEITTDNDFLLTKVDDEHVVKGNDVRSREFVSLCQTRIETPRDLFFA